MEPIAFWMCERNIFPQLLNAVFRNYWLNLVTHTADCLISVISNNLQFRSLFEESCCFVPSLHIGNCRRLKDSIKPCLINGIVCIMHKYKTL